VLGPWEANGVITPFARVWLTACDCERTKLGEHVPRTSRLKTSLRKQPRKYFLRYDETLNPFARSIRYDMIMFFIIDMETF